MNIVTGATGHIGNVLVRQLLKRQEQVTVVIPSFEKNNHALDKLNVKRIEGDVLNIESLIKAFQGAETVYHLAGIINITRNKKNLELMRRVNVEGTKNVIEACKKANIKRLVYTSSIHAFAEPPKGTPITETQPIDPTLVVGEYAKTKAEATQAALQAVKEGLDVVVVCPSGVIGPYDYNISQTGQVFIDYAEGKLKAYMKGEYNYVDVRDVAEGHILAATKGRTGELYILAGEQLTVKRMYSILEEATKKKAPTFIIQPWFAKLTAPLAAIYYRILKSKPLFTKYSVYTLTKSNSYALSTKARNELGYTARPIRETIHNTVEWLEKHNDLVVKR